MQEMQKINDKETVWYEKFKPQCIDDLIIPIDMRSNLKTLIKDNTLPNIALFSTSPGTGKSSTVNAIVKEVNGEAIWINASLENSIDVLRGKILNFASSQSFYDAPKIVVMDEMDHFSAQGQAAFRGFLDEFSSNCKFLFTGNYKEKIIDPLLDRLEVFNYDEFKKQDIVKQIFERLTFILEYEKKTYNKEDIIQVINSHYPSIRSMIGTLQKYSISGTLIIPPGELNSASKFENVMQSIKGKKFKEVIENINNITACASFYAWLYKNINVYFEKEMLPKSIMILAKYQDMDSRAVDKNLNLAACCTELMMQCSIKA